MKRVIVTMALASSLTLPSVTLGQNSLTNTRDAVSGRITDSANWSSDQTRKVFDVTNESARVLARNLRDFVLGTFKASSDVSVSVSDEVIKALAVSRPVFVFTQDAIVWVFEPSAKATEFSIDVSERVLVFIRPSIDKTSELGIQITKAIFDVLGKSTDVTSDVSEKIIDLLDNSSEITVDVLRKLFELLGPATQETVNLVKKTIWPYLVISGKGAGEIIAKNLTFTGKALELLVEALTENTALGTSIVSELAEQIFKDLTRASSAATDVTEFIFEILEKLKLLEPTEASSELVTKVSEAVIKALTKVSGEDNIRAALELTSNGTTLATQGVSAVLYFISAATTGLSNFIFFNRDRIEEAYERQHEPGGQERLNAMRAEIRAEMAKEVESGEALSVLLDDQELDLYISTLFSWYDDELPGLL